ncbi:MAG: diaminopimelate decarboxylase [Bacteroidales bacterium]|nr:diaminopimelate decarboxylase [Bacteroidales bacterium]
MKNNNGQYEIGGISVTSLVEKYDSPLYIYDTAIIKRQYERLVNAFEGTRLRVHYACKALNNINIMRYICGLGAGLDAVSIQEVQLGLKAGFAPSDIIYTSNSVSIREFEEAIAAGVHINIDNLSILEQVGLKYGSSVPVSIRINPHIMGGGNIKISTGHVDSKFGISMYQLPHIQRIVDTYKMNIDGLHMHTGSDILDIEVFSKGAEILFEAAKHFPDLKFLDFGSGFKVPYKPDDYSTDIELLGSTLTQSFNDFCKEYGRELTLKFEPGKFLVSQAGYLAAKVNVVKHTTSTVFAGVNTGLNHLIRPMFYDSYHHIINVSKPDGTPRIYTVVGYICETDTFGWNRKIAEISEGDVLVFLNAGAYGMTMASNYNARLRPAEVMVHEGKDYLIRKRETLDDLLKNQIEVL